MKKLIYLLAFLPLAFMSACTSDDDLPKVDFKLTLSGVTFFNNDFYTVAGEDVTIEEFSAISLNGKNSGVQNVIVYFDGIPMIPDPEEPFVTTFSTEGITPGPHTLGFSGYVLQEGSPITTFVCEYQLELVASEEDLPEGAPEIGTYSKTLELGNES
ncbi:MAG: hypothetical protein J1E78_04575 [Muribaculaceae bacterium]|nr:hypothetical protein [Muribaculaceae bacterium]